MSFRVTRVPSAQLPAVMSLTALQRACNRCGVNLVNPTTSTVAICLQPGTEHGRTDRYFTISVVRNGDHFVFNYSGDVERYAPGQCHLYDRLTDRGEGGPLGRLFMLTALEQAREEADSKGMTFTETVEADGSISVESELVETF